MTVDSDNTTEDQERQTAFEIFDLCQSIEERFDRRVMLYALTRCVAALMATSNNEHLALGLFVRQVCEYMDCEEALPDEAEGPEAAATIN